mgnify:CR=1 FL=1
MKSFIDNNVMEIADLEVSAEGKISEILVVKKVRPSYMKDAEGKITENIENIKYDCVAPETFASVYRLLSMMTLSEIIRQIMC